MSSFGRIFRVTTFGESHGTGIGCIVEGMPAGFPISFDKIQDQLDRRKPGQSSITTSRSERDIVEIQSGIQRGRTLGTPICLFIKNLDIRPSDYARSIPRPGHADFTYRAKYKVNSDSGGGRASARETAARVAAGALALEYLSHCNIEIVAWVHSVSNINISDVPINSITAEEVEEIGRIEKLRDSLGNIYYRDFRNTLYSARGEVQESNIDLEHMEFVNVRSPSPEAAVVMASAILNAKNEGDSLGGVIRCICRGVPAGLGEPCFDKMQAKLAHAMMSIPATKGFEIGSGFGGTLMKGSEHNDMFGQDLKTITNNAGGVLGGISNGNLIDFKVAFKPVSTIMKSQVTADWNGEVKLLENKGRHDPCVLPRAVPIVESMAAITIMDFLLIQNALCSG